MRNARLALFAVVLAGVGALAWWWSGLRAGDDVRYRTARIEQGPLQAAVSASGTVTPVSQVQIGSQVSGQISELFVDFNSEVKQGQLIARLDPETFEYRLRQAGADVEAARASVLTAQANVQNAAAQASRAQVELSEAQRDLERRLGLVAQGFISGADADAVRARVATLAESLKVSQAQVDVARAQVRNAEAIVLQRQAQLDQARVDLSRTQIRSPVDGIVIKRSVEIGQTVAASLQAPELFVIARSLQDMQVEASIDEADISRVSPAQAVSFTIDAFPGRTFEGVVRQVRKAATTTQNVVTYTVVIAFANPASLLLPGMTANVRVVTDTREQVLKVPNAALRVRMPAAQAPPMPASAPAAAVADGGSGGVGDAAPGMGTAMAQLRTRLVTELHLAPVQIEKIDAVFAATRPRFAELRTLPEAERGKARERILADMRATIADQLKPDQRAAYQGLLGGLAGRRSTGGRVYILGDDGKPRVVDVRLGITDGVFTELLVRTGSSEAALLKEGAPVITAVIASETTPSAGGPGARSRTPF